MKKKNILEIYNWLNEAFVHQTEEKSEQDTYSLKNRIIYYKTNDHQPISKWWHSDEKNKSDIPELIISNTYDEESDTGILVFKEPVTSIGDCAFRNCLSLTSVTIPEGVTSIGRSAFWNCSSFISISIPESVTSIGIYAFAHCKSLEKVFYQGKEYRDQTSLINALKNYQVSLGFEDIFNGTILIKI